MYILLYCDCYLKVQNYTCTFHCFSFLCIKSKGATAYGGSHYGPGKGPVFLDNVICSGSENVLANCSHGQFGVVSITCRSHSVDASVSCATGNCNIYIYNTPES